MTIEKPWRLEDVKFQDEQTAGVAVKLDPSRS